jgi:D-glycero-D-manno-heptose 1,7-bisphosphate phosphatase
MKRAVFLDRDGVITVPTSVDGKGFAPRSISEFRFYEGTAESLERIHALGFLALVVSNQPDVANGLLSRSTLDLMNQRIINELAIDEVINCPHNTLEDCLCRKPKPGMLLSAAEKWDLELSESWMIGDRDSDVAAGFSAGCRTIFINRDWRDETGEFADCRTDSLKGAIDLIAK